MINETDILTALIREEETWINTKTSNAIEFHLQHDEKKEDLPLKEQIPKAYHEYLKIFDENEADRFPESRPWDHKIELKEGFQLKSFKSYNLTPEEQTELDKFLKENLEKGYIRPSQSPMATPFFFVKKKDGKLRPCQDYRYLNAHFSLCKGQENIGGKHKKGSATVIGERPVPKTKEMRVRKDKDRMARNDN